MDAPAVPPKILVIRGGAIGDFILTIPVLSALRSQFPGARLEVLGYRHIAGLALVGGLVDDVRSIEAQALAGFFAKGGTLDEKLSAYFGSFSIILSFLYDPDRIFENNVRRCTKALFIDGPHRPEEPKNKHASDVFLLPLTRLAIFEADAVPRLNLLLTGDHTRHDHLTRHPTLAIHPGSGSEKKNWPVDQWARFLDKVIQETTWNLLLAGGEAEGDRLERLAKQLPSERVHMVRNVPLTELAHHLSCCRNFIGHDSGITHLAAALGLPVTVLWGPSNQVVWSPRGKRVQIIADADGLEKLSLENVWQAWQQMAMIDSA
jgi:ADP-heptose:LPS heptosyltransferase